MSVQFGKPDIPDPLLEMTTSIVSAFIANNQMEHSELPTLITSVHNSLSTLTRKSIHTMPRPAPAVPIAKSVTKEYLVCLEDGRKLKMLKRYLRSKYQLSPEEYRQRWELPADYPMVAPSYAKRRSEFAKEIGLGRKK